MSKLFPLCPALPQNDEELDQIMQATRKIFGERELKIGPNLQPGDVVRFMRMEYGVETTYFVRVADPAVDFIFQFIFWAANDGKQITIYPGEEYGSQAAKITFQI